MNVALMLCSKACPLVLAVRHKQSDIDLATLVFSEHSTMLVSRTRYMQLHNLIWIDVLYD